jgi:hypothetical protein
MCHLPFTNTLAYLIRRAVLTAVYDLYDLDELQWWLAIHHNIAILIPGLHKNLEEAGLTHKLYLTSRLTR